MRHREKKTYKKHISSSRKIAYILGAGFSYGTGHNAVVGQSPIQMPLQCTLLKELCVFHHRQINHLNLVVKYIRKYFSPKTYRSQRTKGSKRHDDLYGLSIEEIITFFDELVRTEHPEEVRIKEVIDELHRLTAGLISFLSTNGNPGQNQLLKKFAKRLAQTDVIITFNWDTILDRVLANRGTGVKGSRWDVSWGYGKTVRDTFDYPTYKRSHERKVRNPKKYVKLLKLHGSINWIAEVKDKIRAKVGTVTKGWEFRKACYEKLVMMPPKMIKSEIWDKSSDYQKGINKVGNDAVVGFYRAIWDEAQKQLELCRRIVFIGYSFPPADFAVGNMLRRAISSMKVVKQKSPEIDIVDPNAPQLAERFEQSFKIKVPSANQYLSLQNYLDSTRAR